MQAKLQVLRGAKPTTLAIRLPTVIGRGGDAQLKLPASTVSRQHCELYLFEGQLAVRDLGSANGTVVNGHKVNAPTYLAPDDELAVGPVTMCATLMPSEPTAGLMSTKVGPAAEQQPSTKGAGIARPAPEFQQPAHPQSPAVDAARPRGDDDDSFVGYSEDESGGFLGIVPTARDPAPGYESPVIETETQSHSRVDADESALHKFFNSLDQ